MSLKIKFIVYGASVLLMCYSLKVFMYPALHPMSLKAKVNISVFSMLNIILIHGLNVNKAYFQIHANTPDLVHHIDFHTGFLG